MEEQKTTLVTAKKRKLPSFMTAPSRTESRQNATHEQQTSNRPVKSPKTKDTAKTKVPRKHSRQSQLPLQRMQRPAKSVPAPQHLSEQQQKVLNISDAALVEECKAIISGAAAGTGAVQTEHTTPTEEQHRHDASSSAQSQAVYLDVMDAETQLLELPPDATLVYRAPNQLEQAHCPANHGHKDTGSALSAPVAALNLSVHVHDGQVQPALTSPNSSPELTASANLAGGSQLIGTAAEASIEKQPSASVSNAMVQSYSLPAAKAASHDSGSGMNALLQAMLTGELA